LIQCEVALLVLGARWLLRVCRALRSA
jgi:hypothetical protein